MTQHDTPVDIARPDLSSTIVVGVDGSDDGRRALDWAIEEAKRRDLSLLLVHGVEVTMASASPYGTGIVLEQLEQAAQDVLAEEAAYARASGVPVTMRLEVGSAAYALIEASHGAAMVVVGTRGHGGFAGMLLGSVSTACVHHAHCPVMVVRRPER
jgi:nucleotide-binding universal stress UspA family protein